MKRLVCAALFAFAHSASAEDARISAVFAGQQVEGTLVVSALSDGRSFIHGDARAAQRFACASTFKVFNTLIALQEKAITADSVLRWDGQPHDLPDWNRDQTLASAFRVSCVWCYQQMAARVGDDAYRRYIRDAGYGQLTEPFDTTAFWLDGSLQISAQEQVAFLKQVIRQQLPFDAQNFATLRAVMLAERTPDYALYAKTGWAARATPQIGWYVGYVETPDDTWVFATNITVRNPADLALRPALTKASLKALGILPGTP